MRRTYPDLTEEQAAALEAFAAQHGADWRRKLNDGWLRAAYPGPLQQVRNQFGPTWLAKVYKLPSER